MSSAESVGPPAAAARPDLSNRSLRRVAIALLAAILLYALARPWLPDAFHRPGSPVLQSLAALGALLLLAPFAFTLGKRTGTAVAPNRLFVGHVLASSLGTFLVLVHALGRFEGPPLIMVACLLLLVASGTYARAFLSTRIAAVVGSKSAPFGPPSPERKARLASLIERKTALLRELDPSASEAVFSVTLRHWLRAPLRSLAYSRLAAREARLLGARASVPGLLAWWRPLHLALAWLFLAGLLVHVVVVTFFAGYVADGREIHWWHLTAW